MQPPTIDPHDGGAPLETPAETQELTIQDAVYGQPVTFRRVNAELSMLLGTGFTLRLRTDELLLCAQMLAWKDDATLDEKLMGLVLSWSNHGMSNKDLVTALRKACIGVPPMRFKVAAVNGVEVPANVTTEAQP